MSDTQKTIFVILTRNFKAVVKDNTYEKNESTGEKSCAERVVDGRR